MAVILITFGSLLVSLVIFYFLIYRTRQLFPVVHAAFLIIFMIALQLARLLTTDLDYNLGYYIQSQLVIIIYLLIFAGLLFLCRRWFPDPSRFTEMVRAFPDYVLSLAFMAWLAVKAVLVMRYGAGIFEIFRGTVGMDTLYHFSDWWVTPLDLYSTAFAEGASIIVALKIISFKDYWKKALVTLPFVTFMVLYIVTHEPFVGPRRFILLFALIVLFFSIWKYGKDIIALKQWPKYIAVIVVAVGFTYYYQAIRTNLYQPEIKDLIRTGNPMQMLQGIGQALIPLPNEERIPHQAEYFRPGPFDILYAVVQARAEGTLNTHGLITAQSILQMVPRVLIGDMKTDYTADNFMAAQMGMCTNDCLTLDIATSLSSIMISDFGLFGWILPPFIILLALLVFSRLPRQATLFGSFLTLFWVSAAFGNAGNVEGALVEVFYLMRNALVLFLVLFPLDYVWTHFIKRLIKSRKPKLQNNVNGTGHD
jgi:hypothetical protein